MFTSLAGLLFLKVYLQHKGAEIAVQQKQTPAEDHPNMCHTVLLNLMIFQVRLQPRISNKGHMAIQLDRRC